MERRAAAGQRRVRRVLVAGARQREDLAEERGAEVGADAADDRDQVQPQLLQPLVPRVTVASRVLVRATISA
jgi:hypothetical protein